MRRPRWQAAVVSPQVTMEAVVLPRAALEDASAQESRSRRETTAPASGHVAVNQMAAKEAQAQRAAAQPVQAQV